MKLKPKLLRTFLKAHDKLKQKSDALFATFLFLVTGVHVKEKSVHDGAYKINKRPPIIHKPSDDLLTLAYNLYQDSKARTSSISAKSSTLITITGITASGTGASLSIIGLPSNYWFGGLLIITIFCALSTAWILFKFLGVGSYATPGLDEDIGRLPKDAQRAQLLRDLTSAQIYNDARIDFLVDVYRAGRRMCIIILFLSFGLIVSAVALREGKSDAIILKLRSDPALLKLLQGPQGTQGPEGIPGKQGPTGDIGPKGEPASYSLPEINYDFNELYPPIPVPQLQFTPPHDAET